VDIGTTLVALRQASSGFVGLRQASSGFVRLRWASSGFVGLRQAPSGFVRLRRAPSGYVGLPPASHPSASCKCIFVNCPLLPTRPLNSLVIRPLLAFASEVARTFHLMECDGF
jgi:hypothetical protein